MKNTKRIFKLILAILLVMIAIYIYKNVDIEALKVKIAESGSKGPLIYILSFTVLPAFFFSAAALVIASGALFGFWKAALYTLIAVSLNTGLMFVISRYIAKDFIKEKLKKHVKPNVYNIIYTKDQKKPAKAFFFMRILPAVPYIFENYLGGLTEVKFLPYLIYSLVGVMPGMLVYINIGNNVMDIKSQGFIMSLIILFGLTFGSWFVNKKVFNGNDYNPDL